MKFVENDVHIIYMPDYAETCINIEKIGRTCYHSNAKETDDLNVKVKNAENFIRSRIKQGHESIIEHVMASFRIVCDRGVSHDLVRHRLASFTQESTRYCNYSADKFGNEITVIVPPSMTEQQEKEWKAGISAAESAYFKMLEAGAPPEIAMYVLPHSLKVEICVSANMREWRHILRLRCDKHARPQIQDIAHRILFLFERDMPVFVEDIQGNVECPIYRKLKMSNAVS